MATQQSSSLRFPARFKSLAGIRSMAIKTSFAPLLFSLEALLDDAQPFVMNAKTQRLLNHYLTYLDTTCAASVDVINTRAAWMLTFGQVVVHRLQTDRNARTAQTVGTDSAVHDAVSKTLVNLITAVKRYRARHALSNDHECDIITILDDVCETLPVLVASHDPAKHTAILDGINGFATSLSYRLEHLPSEPDMGYRTMLIRLSEIQYDINLYRISFTALL